MGGWLKLNVDGSVRDWQNDGAAGGVLRDDQGTWQWGFVMKIPQPTILEAEVEVIHLGLSLAWEKRIQKIEVETDSKEAYSLIMEDITGSHPLKQKIDECRILLHKPWNQKFRWINRAKNCLANVVAKLQSVTDRGPSVLLNPPRSLLPFLES